MQRESTSAMNGKSAEITVFLIDDQKLVRASLRRLIETEIKEACVVGDEGDAREAIKRIAELQPHIVILDIAMPGLSGIDSIRPIKDASPQTKVVMASQHEGQQFVRQAIDSGANGYVSKNADPQELRSAIEAVRRGDLFISPSLRPTNVAGGAPNSGVLATLTPREREVFQLLAVGRPNKDIAALLVLSLGTVKKHRENLQRKLGCHSSAELARLAIREGLLGI